MRETRLKSSKGITLIALVITIIVLLILAGVAISMLSGDNGILKQAANAKIEQEAAQEKEATALTDMEVITDFKTSGKSIKYKFKNGYLTGIKLNENKQAETVESVESGLPSNYKIYDIQGNEITNKTEKIVTTGMMIKKGDNTVGRVVIFGDVNCDGKHDLSEATSISRVCYSSKEEEEMGYQDYQVVAMDVNNDKMLNPEDAFILMDYVSKANPELPQDYYAYSYEELDIPYYEETAISEEFRIKYNLHNEVIEEEDMRVINVSADTTVGEILTDLNNEYKTTFNLYNNETNQREAITDKTSDALVTSSSTIQITFYKNKNRSSSISIYVIVE